jgi:hypothetical protein
MFHRITNFVFVLSALFLPATNLSADAFNIAAESAIYDASQGVVNFRLTFTQTPDFYTLDGNGNPTNSFQYRFLGDLSREYPVISLQSSEAMRYTCRMQSRSEIALRPAAIPVLAGGALFVDFSPFHSMVRRCPSLPRFQS